MSTATRMKTTTATATTTTRSGQTDRQTVICQWSGRDHYPDEACAKYAQSIMINFNSSFPPSRRSHHASIQATWKRNLSKMRPGYTLAVMCDLCNRHWDEVRSTEDILISICPSRRREEEEEKLPHPPSSSTLVLDGSGCLLGA